MLYIDKIIETMPYGKTKPIKVKASDGEVYVVKFRKDNIARKDRSITNEFIAYRLIENLEWEIAPLPLELIQIDTTALELAEDAFIDPLSLAYMKESLGVNVAIPYIDNCEKAEGEIENQNFIKHLRTIDNVLLNDDRDIENPNILKDQTASNRYYAIDWGLAMDSTDVYKDIKTGNISTRMMYFQTCNVVRRPEYILRGNLTRVTLKSQEIEGIIHEIIEEIPQEWETYSDRAHLEEILCARAVSKKIFE
ncbi:MAG: Unknown protein [uncultured Sulfurovum sp.]|uniref:HipA-like kinase domain-containing protein n=1 Tax=uncultured Sulfurovum sp. TaxID=269237 RepID=A0A6S6TKD2_9BACT|nr:MAG: Unknown protein [uncultured Sulfurovum sp.]